MNEGYENLTTTISKHGEQWHKEIDIVINRVKSEINEIKVNHREILQKHSDVVKQIPSLMKHSLRALNEIEQSTKLSLTIRYSSKIREFSKLIPKVMVTMPTFTQKLIDHKKLYSLFRQITSLSIGIEENISSLSKQKSSVRELLEKPQHVTTIKTAQHC